MRDLGRSLLTVSAALLVALGWAPASAQQPRGDEPARQGGPVVLLLDTGRARGVRSDDVLARVATELGRDVVRITDSRARNAVGTLTVAYEAPNRWLVRYEAQGHSASSHELIERPGLLSETLAAASARMMAEVEGASNARPAATRRESADDVSLYIAWANEILDPFVVLPPPPRREIAIYSEVIDPFAPSAPRRAFWTEVLDPWDR